MGKQKETAVQAKATDEKSTKVTPRKRRKVPARVMKRIKGSCETAVKTATELDSKRETQTLPTGEKAAMEGIKAVQGIIKKGTAVDGLSPLGHKASCQNGQLDIALLSGTGVDFTTWVTSVCEANCESRRSDLDDDATFVKRLQSHLKFVSGRKHSGKVGMPKRLEKVGLDSETKAVFKAMYPVSELFDEYVKAGKF